MSRRSHKRARRRKDAPSVVQTHYPCFDTCPGNWSIQPYDVVMPAPTMTEQERVHVTIGGNGVIAKAIERTRGKR